jgi:hypothetical protein
MRSSRACALRHSQQFGFVLHTLSAIFRHFAMQAWQLIGRQL